MPELNQREALYGFVSWLSTRKELIEIGSSCECAGLTELIERFSNANGFDGVSDGWEDILFPPAAFPSFFEDEVASDG